MPSPSRGLKAKLEEDVVLPLATLAGEHEHGVARDRDREVAAGGRTLAKLHHLLPTLGLVSLRNNYWFIKYKVYQFLHRILAPPPTPY